MHHCVWSCISSFSQSVLDYDELTGHTSCLRIYLSLSLLIFDNDELARHASCFRSYGHLQLHSVTWRFVYDKLFMLSLSCRNDPPFTISLLLV